MSYKAAVLGIVATLLVAPVLAADTAPAKPSATKPAAPPSPASPAATPSQGVAPNATPGTAQPLPPVGHGPLPEKKSAIPEKKIDLNNATAAELKTIPGVGDAEAKKIIANRPYKAKTELVTKAGLPEGIYVSARHRVELQEMKKPGSKTGASKPADQKPGAATSAPSRSEATKADPQKPGTQK